MGNSEVGHMNIGAGRIVYQSLTRINKSIEDGEFFENDVLNNAIKHVKITTQHFTCLVYYQMVVFTVTINTYLQS